MTEIVTYFESIPSLHRALLIAGGITFFWIIETIHPFIRFNYKKWQHARINIFFTITTIVVNFCMAFLLVKTVQFTTTNHFGFLHWIAIDNFWVFTIVGLLLLDFFGAYLVHLIEHKVKFLWRFHLIHHTDTFIDTTTANRHHPGESVLRFLFTTIGVLIVGCPIWLVFMYQFLSVLLSQFNHANVVLPKRLDYYLSYFIVTPDMHKVHHHYVLPYTDSNYGNIFSVWDRIFNTFRTLDRSQIVYGIDTHMKPDENNKLDNLLQIPFQKHRSPTIE
jgi:sterol desaturase/sphingolipid hydroxylase (fatty acid hydroxylase superfamily)